MFKYMKLLMVFLGFGGVLATAFAATFELIQNFQGSQVCSPERYFEPRNVEEVQGIVATAREVGRTVMTGNRKFASQIDAACADSGADQISVARLNYIRIDKDSRSVTVGAGVRFRDLSDALAGEGFAINHVTELSSATIGGMLGSGSHGSTIQRPAATLSDYATQIVAVDGRGERVALVGSDLDAFRVNLGVLGVVVEATFPVEPLFKVSASRHFGSDEKLEDEILSLAENHYSVNLAWFPGLSKFSATIFDRAPAGSLDNAYNGQAELNDMEIMGFKTLFSSIASKDTQGSCTVAELRYSSRIANYFKKDDGSKAQEYSGSLSDGSEVKKVVGYSHRMQYFTCRSDDRCVWDIIPIQLQEIGIAFEDLPAAMKDIRQILAKKPACFPLNGVYMRFVPESKSLIGMNSGRKTAFLGIEFALNGDKPPLNYDVLQEIEQLLLFKYRGRPHWGKNTIPLFLDINRNYDKERWQSFLSAKKRFDPDGVFVNAFWRRIVSQSGDSIRNDLLVDGCVAKGLCYCREDRHCNKDEGERCLEGRFFNQAKTCRKD